MEGHRKGRTRPSNLREQVDPETMKMYPTPTATERSGINPKTGKGAGLSKMVKMMYPTPTQDSASERTKKYKQGGKPLTVAVQEEEKRMYPTPRSSGQENPETLIKRKGMKAAAQHNLTAAVKMYPTPTVDCEEGGQQSERVERTKSGGFILRKKEKQMYHSPTTNDAKNLTFPKSQRNRSSIIGDMMRKEIYPTPAQRDYKDVTLSKSYKNRNSDSLPIKMMKQNKPGGKLNPTFVEFLMGFPMNWTKTEPTESKPLETQSSHKSQGSSDSQSKKFYPTPRANEPGRTTKGYGRGLAELMEGKEQVEPKK